MQGGNSTEVRLEQGERDQAPGTRGTILPMLLQDLHDPNPRVRILAIKEITGCEGSVVVERLIEIARHDPHLEVRCTAISELGNFIYMGGISAYDPETDQDILDLDDCVSKEDFERVYEFLLSVYRDRTRPLDERRYAVEAQSFFGNETVEEMIAELYARPEKPAKLSALLAMGRNGSSRWVQTLEKELYSADRDLQLEAIYAAGEASLDSLGKDLWRLTFSENKDTLLAAIWSLGQTGWDGAFERLDELTLHHDSEIREVADEAMDEWMFYNGLASGLDETGSEEPPYDG